MHIQIKSQQLYELNEHCVNFILMNDDDDNVNDILISSIFEIFEVCFITLSYCIRFSMIVQHLAYIIFCLLVSITRCIAPAR
jgi:hypothetical protein